MLIETTQFAHSVDGGWSVGSKVLPLTTFLQHSEDPSWRGKTIAEDAELEGPNSVPNVNMEAISPFICIADPLTLRKMGISIRDLTLAVNSLSEEERKLIGRQTGFRIDDPLLQNYGLSPTYQNVLRQLMLKNGNLTEEGVSYAYSRGGWWTAASTFKEGLPTQFMQMDEATIKTFLRLAIATSLLPLRDLLKQNPELVREVNKRAFDLGKIYYKALHRLRDQIGRTPTIQEFFEYATQFFEEELFREINISNVQLLKEEQKKEEGKYRSLVQLCNEYGITHVIAGDQHPGWESGVKRLAANIELYTKGHKDDPFSHLTGSFEMYRLNRETANNPDLDFIELTLREQEVVTQAYNEAIRNLGGSIRLLNPNRNDTLVFLNTELGRRELRRRKIDNSGSIEWVFVEHSNENDADLSPVSVRYIFVGEENKYALYVNGHFIEEVKIESKNPNLEMMAIALEQELVKRMVGEEVAVSLKAVAALPAYQYSGNESVKKALLLPRFGSSYSPISAEFLRLLREKLPNERIPPVYVIRQHQQPYDALGSLGNFPINLGGEYGNFLGYFLGRSQISTSEFSRNWREYEKKAKVLLNELLISGDLRDKFEIMLRQMCENNMASPVYISWIEDAYRRYCQVSQTTAERKQDLSQLQSLLDLLKAYEESHSITPINTSLEELIAQAENSISAIISAYSQVLPASLSEALIQYEKFLNTISSVTEEKPGNFSLGLLSSIYNLSHYARFQLAQLSLEYLISSLNEANEESLRQLGRELGFSQLAYNEQNVLTPEIVISVLKKIAEERFRGKVKEVEEETGITEQSIIEKKDYIRSLTNLDKGLRELRSNFAQWKNKSDEEKRKLLKDYLNSYNLDHLMPSEDENIDDVLIRLLKKVNCYTSSVSGLNIIEEIKKLMVEGDNNKGRMERLTRELIKTLKKLLPQLDDSLIHNLFGETKINVIETLKSIIEKKGEISSEDVAAILSENEDERILLMEKLKDLFEGFIIGLNPQYFKVKEKEAEVNALERQYLIRLAEKLTQKSRDLGYQERFPDDIDLLNLDKLSNSRLRNFISFFNPNVDNGSLVLAYDFRGGLRQFQDKLEEEGNLYAKINNFLSGKNPFTVKLIEEINRLQEKVNNLKKEIETREGDNQYKHDLALLKTALAAHVKVLDGMTHLSKANSRQPFATLYLLGGPRMVEEVIKSVFYTLEIL